MAVTRDDIQDATGQRSFISGRGHTRAFPMSANSGDYNATTGVPANSTVGYSLGCIWQNHLAASAATALYVNVGTESSSTWQQILNGGGGQSISVIAITSATAATWTIPANTQHALDFTDGTTNIIDIDTRNTVTGVVAVTITASPPTIASATGDTFSNLKVAAGTVTLTGTTLVTALDGIGAYLGIPTVTDSMAVTVSTISNLFVDLPAAAGMVTGTAIYTANFNGAVKIAAGGINFAAAAQTVTVKANTTATLAFSDGTTSILSLDSRNTVTGVAAVAITASPPTITSATGDTFSQVKINAVTVTLTGTTTVTALDGIGAFIGVPTVTDTMAATVTTVSNLYVALPVAAGMITGTNIFSAHFAGAIAVDAGGINFSAAAQTVTVKANTAATLAFSDGTTSLVALDTRNTVTGVKQVLITPSAPTITSATGDAFSTFSVAAVTVTLTGTTTVTALDGIVADFGTPTVTDASAVTVTTVSALKVRKPVAAGMVTITNNYIINTDVAGAFLTAAGVWTDACSQMHKYGIVSANTEQTLADLDRVDVRRYKRHDASDGGFERYGVIAEEVPDFLATPNRDGVSPGYIASFALAALKALKAEYDVLKRRLEALEAA